MVRRTILKGMWAIISQEGRVLPEQLLCPNKKAEAQKETVRVQVERVGVPHFMTYIWVVRWEENKWVKCLRMLLNKNRSWLPKLIDLICRRKLLLVSLSKNLLIRAKSMIYVKEKENLSKMGNINQVLNYQNSLLHLIKVHKHHHPQN